jgi:EAL domain-containing protein (putative c-di-GMP-specific phosphodiesterase class I)
MKKINVVLIENSCADNCVEKILDNDEFSVSKIDSPGTIGIYDFPAPSLIICRKDENINDSDIRRILNLLNPAGLVPVLFIVSPDTVESYLQILYSGISHHITSPFSRDFLYSRIFNLLGSYVKADSGKTEFEIEYNSIRKEISLPNTGLSGFLVSALENSIYKNSIIGRSGDPENLKDELDIKNRLNNYKTKLEFARAIENDEWILNYQPVLSLENKKLFSFEALIRWNNPERGILPPKDFIEEVEKSPLIIPIGFIVIEKAVAQLKKWHQKFGYPMKISINLSPNQFTCESLFDKIIETVDSVGLPHESIAFEITENVFSMDMEAANLMLLKLRAQKFNIYLDDFGTGYSSFSYLYHFPVDVIKIDQSFVRWMNIDETSEHIVKSIISLAHNLNIKIIAEGAETQNHIERLEEYGADFVQGYYFAKPLNEEDADQYIANFAKH